MTITEITSELLAVLRTAIRSTAAGCKRFLKKTFAVNETIQNVAFGLLAMAILGATSHTTSASVSVSDNLCTTNHCWTVTNQDQTVLWVGITLDATYIDVPVDSGSDSVIDGWERVSIYLEYDGQEYLISNHDGAAFQMDQAPSNLDKFNLAMQSGSIRVKAGPNFTLTELFTRYQGARVRLGFAAYQGYSVDDVNLEFNQVTVKRPIDGTGNRDEGFCAELFAGDVVDLNDGVPDEEGQGFSVVTENPITLPDNSLLYGQGFFGRALFCANTPLLTATAPIWVIDGRGGKRFMGNVELSIVEERVSGGSVNYSNKTSNNADDNDGDGIENNQDAFPNDPAASVDTDGDGLPDYWNAGKTASDSSSSPQLSLDNDDDNDQIVDSEDVYPYDWDRSELEGSKLRRCESNYCLVQTVEPVKDEIQYLYRVSSEAKDYEFLHAENGWALEDGGGSSSTNFDFFDGTKWTSYRDQSGSVADTTRLSLKALFQQSQGTVRLRLSEGSGLGWVALSLVKAGARPIVIFIMQDTGYRLSEFSQTARAVSFTRPEPGTGNHRNTDQCSTFDYEGMGLPAFSPFSFNLMSPSRFIPIGNEGRAWNLRAAGSEIFICADTPVGIYDLTFEVVDGAGGKQAFPLTMRIEEERVEGGGLNWFTPEQVSSSIASDWDCKNAYCVVSAWADEKPGANYFYALSEGERDFPFEHQGFDLAPGPASGSGYSLNLGKGLDSKFLEFSNTLTGDAYERLRDAFRGDDYQLVTLSRPASRSSLWQVIEARKEDGEEVRVFLFDDQGGRVENLRQINSHIKVARPVEGTGTAQVSNSCTDFRDTWDLMAPGLLGRYGLAFGSDFPASPAQQVRWPYLAGLGHFYWCSDSPTGLFETSMLVMDGRGGKVEWPLTIEVTEEKAQGGAIEWFKSKAAAGLTAEQSDRDGDGVPDDLDAFPNDPAASVDTDGDGKPDDWNEGKSAADSSSDPILVIDEDDDNDGIPDYLDEFPLVASTDPLDRLIDPNGDYDGDGVPNASDHFPQDASESLDLDFDGLGNNADDDDDGDGVLDEDDAFRFNPFETVDSDGDGVGDFVDAAPNNGDVTSLVISEALAGIIDTNLRVCLTNRTQGLAYAGELTELVCGYDLGESIEVYDLTGLRAFHQLTYIELKRGAPTSLEPIHGLYKLQRLRLNNLAWDFHDFDQLAPFYSLTEFGSDSFQNVQPEELEILGRLPRLTNLSVGSYFSLKTLSFVSKMPRLRQLWISYSEIEDYSQLESLYYLKTLWLDFKAGPKFSDLSFLTFSPNLKELGLAGANLEGLTGIEQARNLENLTAWEGPISDISLLADLAHLKNLNLFQQRISDITPLAGLQQLETVNLAENNLSSLGTVLINWGYLTSFNLTANPLPCSEIEAARANANLTILFEGDCDDSSGSVPNLDSIALLINSDTTGAFNSGEVGLIGVDEANQPLINSDGSFVWNNSTITVARNQYEAYTLFTNTPEQKGFIAVDISGSAPFRIGFDNTTFGNINVAFVWKEGEQWKYDQNQGGEPVDWTPSNTIVALGWLQTSQPDVIYQGELFQQPVLLSDAAFNDHPLYEGIDQCGNNFCVLNESSISDNDRTYFYSLTETAFSFPFDQTSYQLSNQRESGAQNFQFELFDGAAFQTIQLGQDAFSSETYNLLATAFANAAQQPIKMKRTGTAGDWIELRLNGPNESVKVVLHDHLGADVSALVQQSKYLQVKRPLAGTGNRGGFESDTWACSSFSYNGWTNQQMNGFAANGSTNLPQGMYIGGGPQLVEMVFCDAAPVGTTDHLITVIDGRGGKTDLTLTVEVLAEKTDGGSIQWFASNPNNDGSDSDGDGVPNNEDAFPDDPAASRDNDSDGRPDRWNLGRNGVDSTSTPKLVLDDDDDNDGVLDAVDQMPFDASESLDFDGDGIGDKADNDDDDDGVADADDAFPYDAYNSVDSDGDGVGDNWDAYPNDASQQSLSISNALNRVVDSALRNCIAKTTSGLERADEVREIVCQTKIETLEGIENFYRVEKVWFWDGVGGDSLRPVSALTQLREFLTSGDLPSSDLSPLDHLFKLRTLSIQDISNVDSEDYEALSRLHNLDNFSPTGLSSYSMLKYYPRLKTVIFPRNRVRDHSPIGQLEFLETLYLYDNETPLESTDWLNSLTNLTFLSIHRMGFSDTGFLSFLTNLEEIDIGGNPISEVNSLSSLSKLVTVRLRDNQIQKVLQAFGGWTQNASIDLTGNPLLCSELSSLESKSNLTITFDSNCVTDSQNSYIIQGGPCEVLPEHCHEFPVNVTNSSTEFVRNYRYTFAEYPEFRNYPLPGFSGVQFFDGGGPFDVWIKSGSQETRWSNVRSDCLPDPYSQCPGENSSTGRPNWYNPELDWEAYQDNWRGADIELAIADYPYIDELIGSTQEGSKQISLRIGLLADQGLRAENIALPYSKLEIKPPVPGTGDIGFQGGNCAQVDRGQIFPYMIGQYSNVSLLGDTHISGPSGFPVFEWSGQYIWMCSDHPPGEYDLTLRVYDGIGFKEHPLQLVISSQKVSGGSFTFSDAVIVSDDADGDGVADNFDAFPNDPAASKDFDRDGKPDEWNDGNSAADSTSQPPLEQDNDDDNDGVADDLDCYPLDSTRTICDADLDGVEDGLDNCPAIANPGQEDFDGDGLGDACDNDDDGDQCLDRDDDYPLNPARCKAGKQKAVVVAGGGPYQGNYLWKATEAMAEFAITSLRGQGIARDDILYLSAGFGDAIEPDDDATKQTIEDGLLNWTQGDDPADDVLVYLVDHGGPGVFELDEKEKLGAGQLKQWLDTLQDTIPGAITVVYDACQSGSFTQVLGTSDYDRLIIASAADNEPAIFASDGDISFSQQFWSTFLVSGDLYRSYVAGAGAMGFVAGHAQTAQVEVDGDGQANTKQDRTLAQGFSFGKGITLASDLPAIGSVSAPITLAGQMSTRLAAFDVAGTSPVVRVWAIVDSPDEIEASPDTPIVNIEQFDLSDEDGDGIWEGNFNNFEIRGTYEIQFFAQNENGYSSLPTKQKPNRTVVIQTLGRDPLIGRDTDRDGVGDRVDAFPFDPNHTSDIDGDLIPDELDGDIDGNGEKEDRKGPDAFEPNNVIQDASFIALGTSTSRAQVHDFTDTKDVDLVWFYAEAGVQYDIDAYPIADQLETGPDLQVTLFDSDDRAFSKTIEDRYYGGDGETYTFTPEISGAYTAKITQSGTVAEVDKLSGPRTEYAVKLSLVERDYSGGDVRPTLRFPNYAAVGGIANAEIKVENVGVAAGNYQVRLSLPRNGEAGGLLPEGCIAKGRTVFCATGELGPNASVNFSIPLRFVAESARAQLAVTVFDGAVGKVLLDANNDDNAALKYIVVSSDNDGDKLPDEYELRKGLDPSVNDAESDLDGDGITNLDEYLTGTDPASVDEDRDGDGYADISDLFPDNPEEWADADLDNTGDNEDADDDNDNVLDIDDAFPFQGAYSQDSDLDGLPNAWETANGLNPNDPRDAYQDLDIDGLLNRDEFVLGADPSASDGKAQVVYTEGDNRLSADEITRLAVFYDTTDANPELSGLGVRVHVDTELIESLNLVNVLQQGLLSVDGQSQVDIADLDRDLATDGFWQVAWSSTSATWPGSVPIKLFDIEVLPSVSGIEAGEIAFRFSVSEKAAGYEVSGASIYSPITSASLDIDGDGTVGALTDGLLVIRHLFGFTGDALISGALSADASVTQPAAITEQINGLGLALDIDGSGKAEALTDGLLVIRRLFGFDGAALVSGALATNATRTDAAVIAAYIDGLSP